MPSAYALLVANVALNQVNVECRNAAVAADSGHAELYVDGEDLFFPSLIAPSFGARSVTVPAFTLAGIMQRDGLDRVDLLKLDIEGAEYDVLYSTPPDCLARISEIRMEAHDLDGERRNPAAHLAEATFIERGYPHSFIYKPMDDLISPGFPAVADLERMFG